MPIVSVSLQTTKHLTQLLDVLADVCRLQIQRGGLPVLYRSGIRYKREAPNVEQWQTAEETWRKKSGDCEDLVAYRVGELRAAGVAARPLIYVVRPGLRHCVVVMPDGRREDPSKRLGMGGAG